MPSLENGVQWFAHGFDGDFVGFVAIAETHGRAAAMASIFPPPQETQDSVDGFHVFLREKVRRARGNMVCQIPFARRGRADQIERSINKSHLRDRGAGERIDWRV